MNRVKDLEDNMKSTAFKADVDKRFPTFYRIINHYKITNNLISQSMCLMLVLALGKILTECQNRKEILELIKGTLDGMIKEH